MLSGFAQSYVIFRFFNSIFALEYNVQHFKMLKCPDLMLVRIELYCMVRARNSHGQDNIDAAFFLHKKAIIEQ